MTNFEKRCEDCACLVQVGRVACCSECFNQPIVEIDDCPEGIELEEVKEMQAKEKIKVDHGAKTDKPKKASKPRTVVTSDEKKEVFSTIFGNLAEVYGENAKIEKENKLIFVQIGEKIFKIDLIEQRKPKK